MVRSLKNPFKNKDVVDELIIDFQRAYSSKEEATAKVEQLCSWLCTTPPNVVFRINTLVTDKNKITDFIENTLLQAQSSLPDILYLPKIPELIIFKSWDECVKLDLDVHPNEVIVDAACGAAILRGAHIYAPGIMGFSHGLKIGETVSVFVDIANACKKGLYKTFENDEKRFVGNGVVNMTRESLFRHDDVARGIAVFMSSVVSRVPQLNEQAFPKGWAMLQNLPSIICSRVLEPGPGETILDMCAAPGNKTTHIGARMKNQGTLVAVEKNKRKMDALKMKCKNFGLTNTRIFCFDSTISACDIKEKLILEGPPFSENIFDRILLDGPCSALGQRPQFSNAISVPELRSYVSLQRKLFCAAVRLLKPCGTLVYSTCTVTVAENEGIVSWALKNFPNLHLASIPKKLENLEVENFFSSGLKIPGLEADESKKLCRFGPNENSVGFFIACFVKDDTANI